jgi:hypothetical protein
MRVRGLVVMIVACQVKDPGSIPGERIFVLALTNQPPMCGTTETRQDIKVLFCSFSNPIHETFIEG